MPESPLIRVDPKFKKMIDQICREAEKNGIRMTSRDITKALTEMKLPINIYILSISQTKEMERKPKKRRGWDDEPLIHL